MINKEVLGGLLDHKKVSVLKTLYFAREEMYLRELAKKSQVSVTSVFRILTELTKIGLIRQKEVGMMKFFSLVRDGRERFLNDWFKEDSLLDSFIKTIKTMKGAEKLLLYGSSENNRASTILIGEDIDEMKIDEICDKFKEKGFDLSCVVFSRKQFEKLDRMGMYSGEKKVLLETYVPSTNQK